MGPLNLLAIWKHRMKRHHLIQQEVLSPAITGNSMTQSVPTLRTELGSAKECLCWMLLHCAGWKRLHTEYYKLKTYLQDQNLNLLFATDRGEIRAPLLCYITAGHFLKQPCPMVRTKTDLYVGMRWSCWCLKSLNKNRFKKLNYF